MKKIFFSALVIFTLLLTGCSSDKVENISTELTNNISSEVDIYVSDDVDVFGNKIGTNPVEELRKEQEKPLEVIEETTTEKTDELKIYFIDVGQADCTLIKISDDENILIDGGNNADGDYLVEYLKSLGVEHIDTIVATHPHEDHIGGLDTIIDNIPSDKIYMPYINEKDIPTTKTYKDFLESVYNNELIVCEAKNNDYIYDIENIKMQIISPDSIETGDLNDYSIVTKLDFYNNSFLFTGDASIKINNEIMKNYDSSFLDIDVLKVGHHGSRTATDDKWLKTLTPEYGIIMCEEGNEYGHPHKEILDLLSYNNVNVLRTDIDGTIELISDGNNIKIN